MTKTVASQQKAYEECIVPTVLKKYSLSNKEFNFSTQKEWVFFVHACKFIFYEFSLANPKNTNWKCDWLPNECSSPASRSVYVCVDASAFAKNAADVWVAKLKQKHTNCKLVSTHWLLFRFCIHAHFLCLPFFFARSLLFLSLSPPLIFSPLRDICHLLFVRGSLVVLFSLHVHFGVVCSHWKNLLGGDKPKPLCYTTL